MIGRMSPCHNLRSESPLSWLHMSCILVAWSLQTVQADTTGVSWGNDSLQSTYTILWFYIKSCGTREAIINQDKTSVCRTPETSYPWHLS